jgi:hypothetical protein
LERHDPQVITRAIDDLLDELEPESDAWLQAAGRRTLERSEW